MAPKLGNLTGRPPPNIDRDPDDGDESAEKNHEHKPRRDVPDSHRPIERVEALNRLRRMEEEFHDPRDHDKEKDENVVAFQTPPERLQHADFERWQDQIFADQFFPFALQQMTIFHDHRHEEMRFEHADTGAKGIVKTVTAGLDPEHNPDNGEVEEEDEVRNSGVRESDRDDRGRAGHGPVGRSIEASAPDHDATELAAIKMRHGVDIALVVNAALDGVRRFVDRSVSFVGHAWRMIRLRRGARQSIN